MIFGYLSLAELDKRIHFIFGGNPINKEIEYYQELENENGDGQIIEYCGKIIGEYPTHLLMLVYGEHENFKVSINKKDLIGERAAKITLKH
jgi:hypothetical protein